MTFEAIKHIEKVPGHFDTMGVTLAGEDLIFTIQSTSIASCSLCLFEHGAKQPFLTIPFKAEDRLGDVYSMRLKGLARIADERAAQGKPLTYTYWVLPGSQHRALKNLDQMPETNHSQVEKNLPEVSQICRCSSDDPYAEYVTEQSMNGSNDKGEKNQIRSPHAIDPYKCQSVLDPYARIVNSHALDGAYPYRGQLIDDVILEVDFDWSNDQFPNYDVRDLIIYEMHVGGYTAHHSSQVIHPGTYLGLIEKIPYLKKLGINAVELLPVFAFDPMNDHRYNDAGESLVDYWGYNPISYFSPHDGYHNETSQMTVSQAFKYMVYQMHQHGIEVILDVVYNHTAENDQYGRPINFKALDPSVYYFIEPDGTFANYSGCGNAINANHPIVMDLICESVRHWVRTYHVDGFRFDLASILTRGASGEPMKNPPVIERLSNDPLLRQTKFIAEAWDAAGLYQVGQFPGGDRWLQWNGCYRDDVRRFLKGDAGLIRTMQSRLAGSPDLFKHSQCAERQSINFITCHDGFTLFDVFTYQTKYNWANGWHNADGTNDHHSWNCGIEGDTDDCSIGLLRQQMMRNAFALLFTSRGIPMFLAGDEFGNTQYGNNNAYCQNNETSWLDWSKLDAFQDLFDFVQYLIQIRQSYPIFSRTLEPPHADIGLVTYHGHKPYNLLAHHEDRYMGVMYAGHLNDQDQYALINMNMYWQPAEIELPALPDGYQWEQLIDTSRSVQMAHMMCDQHVFIEARSIQVYVSGHIHE